MKLIPDNTRIDFMGRRRLAMVISGLVLLASAGFLALQWLNLGIDFTGGVLVEVEYPQQVELNTIRDALAAGGFEDATVQYFGTATDVLIRLVPDRPAQGQDQAQAETEEGGDAAARVSSEVLAALKQQQPEVEMRRVEFVGPQVGAELRDKGGLALLWALFGILIYVIFRFHWKFSLGSVAALAHDVIITVGFFAVTRIEFDLTVIAALLAVIGYSLNDTIVVFDRIRENFLRMRKADTEEVMNSAINQTLSRTLMTGVTTLLVLVALLLIGGEALVAFSVALIVGIVVGTYSSIFVASALALWLNVTKEDLFPPKEEEAERHL